MDEPIEFIPTVLAYCVLVGHHWVPIVYGTGHKCKACGAHKADDTANGPDDPTIDLGWYEDCGQYETPDDDFDDEALLL